MEYIKTFENYIHDELITEGLSKEDLNKMVDNFLSNPKFIELSGKMIKYIKPLYKKFVVNGVIDCNKITKTLKVNESQMINEELNIGHILRILGHIILAPFRLIGGVHKILMDVYYESVLRGIVANVIALIIALVVAFIIYSIGFLIEQERHVFDKGVVTTKEIRYVPAHDTVILVPIMYKNYKFSTEHKVTLHDAWIVEVKDTDSDRKANWLTTDKNLIDNIQHGDTLNMNDVTEMDSGYDDKK